MPNIIYCKKEKTCGLQLHASTPENRDKNIKQRLNAPSIIFTPHNGANLPFINMATPLRHATRHQLDLLIVNVFSSKPWRAFALDDLTERISLPMRVFRAENTVTSHDSDK